MYYFHCTCHTFSIVRAYSSYLHHHTHPFYRVSPILPLPSKTEEAERSLHDALCVLTETIKETRVVCGGGCMEMLMAAAIDK